MADHSNGTGNPLVSDTIQDHPSQISTETGNSHAADFVKAIFADPEALQLLRSALVNNSSDGATKAPNEVSKEAPKASYETAYLEPESTALSQDGDEADEELASPASRWQTSPELGNSQI